GESRGGGRHDRGRRPLAESLEDLRLEREPARQVLGRSLRGREEHLVGRGRRARRLEHALRLRPRVFAARTQRRQGLADLGVLAPWRRLFLYGKRRQVERDDDRVLRARRRVPVPDAERLLAVERREIDRHPLRDEPREEPEERRPLLLAADAGGRGDVRARAEDL